MGTRTKIALGIGAVVALAAAVLIGRATVDEESAGGQVVIHRPVEQRTLQDVLTIRGELRREELQRINSPVDGKISSVDVDDGDTVEPGDTLFALDGRSAVAVTGDFAFFRPLDVGSDGPDVRQLERILSEAGYDVGEVDELFTEDTRAGLRRWQFDRGYGGATPEAEETVTVSLSANSAGYTIGKRNTVAVTIGPAVSDGGGGTRSPTSQRGPLAQDPEPRPTISVSVAPDRIDEGQTTTFTFTADPAPTTDLTIDIGIDGDATGGAADADDSDYVEIDDTFVFPAGQTRFDLVVQTLADQVVESDEDIVVSLSDQFGNDPLYIVGPVNTATAVIGANGDDLLPLITLEASTDVIDEGSSATLTFESTVESNEDLDIHLLVSGTAIAGRDVVEIDDEITLEAGSTEVTLDIEAREDDTVEPDEFFTVRIVASPDDPQGEPSYGLTLLHEVTIKIQSSDVPEMTIRGGGTIAEGERTGFTIVADEPVVEDTSVNYQVSGSASPGEDYEVLPGTVVMRAGSSQVSVGVQAVDDDVVFLPSDMIVADWPARVGSVLVDPGEFVLQGAEMMTLTDPEFTITMQVNPSDRSELSVGLPVTVEVEAGDLEADGVISQLDDNATIDGDGSETYEGEIDVADDLAAVDGALVTIDVILDERLDVLAVPLAAVLGAGNEREVRIVDDDGRLDRRTVEVGLVDGEWIEVVSGLEGDELVVVSVEQDTAA